MGAVKNMTDDRKFRKGKQRFNVPVSYPFFREDVVDDMPHEKWLAKPSRREFALWMASRGLYREYSESISFSRQETAIEFKLMMPQ